MIRASLAALLVLATASASALPVGDKRCGTGALWHSAIQKPRFRWDGQPGGERTLLNLFGDPAYVTTSEHFAFWAGNYDYNVTAKNLHFAAAPDPVAVGKVLAALEAAYAFEVEMLGYPAPSQRSYINIYLGSSGQGVPEVDDSVLAYTYLDDSGAPFIVLHPDTFAYYSLSDPKGTDVYQLADVTLAHEFFHVLQYTAESLEDENSFWYWEATATWMESELYPDSVWTNGYQPAYLATPRRSLAYFAWNDYDELSVSRPYGASIFVTYLSDNVGGRDLVKYTFLDAKPQENVFEVLARRLPELGTSLGAVVSDFAAHNAVLDYQRRTQLFAELDLWGYDETIGSVPLPPGQVFAYSKSNAPQNLGYNVHALPKLANDHELVFGPISVGSSNTKSKFGVEIARRNATGVTYTPVVGGRARIAKSAPGETIFVTVAAIPDGSRDYEETFAYTIELKDSSSGCSTSGAPTTTTGSGLCLLLALAVVRRSRMRPTQTSSG